MQLFDLETDPEELINLAAAPDANAKLILQLNDLLNETIAREIGEDDGAEVKNALKIIQELEQKK